MREAIVRIDFIQYLTCSMKHHTGKPANLPANLSARPTYATGDSVGGYPALGLGSIH